MHKHVSKLIWTPTASRLAREKAWIAKEIDAIGFNNLENLARVAAAARKRTYSPYSHYAVGAAVLDIHGNIHEGQNIEVASYSESGHAEEQAMKNAVSGGAIQKMGRAFVRAVAVAHKSNSSPCGRCRQIMQEFTNNALIVIADPKGNIRRITSLGTILPDSFGPKDLL